MSPPANSFALSIAAAILIALGYPAATSVPAAVEPPMPWGVDGHRITGLIAEHHLTDKARLAIRQLTEGASLAELSTWADDIKSDTSWDYASIWHYINIDDLAAKNPDPASRYAAASVRSRGNIVEAIKYFESMLRQEKAAIGRRQIALKFLVHFVGDLHQPLHAGRVDDQGGNRVAVHWFGELSNLHSIWDSKLIESQKLSYTEFAGFIDRVPADSVGAWQRSNCLDWMNESYDLRRRAYDLEDLSRHTDREGRLNLGYAYSFEAMPVIKRRLVQGGVRLAGLLNSIFDASTRTTCDLPVVKEAVQLRSWH
jgi:hypothetical protein